MCYCVNVLRKPESHYTCIVDAETGIITNRMKLNREIKSRYTLIILVKDGGVIPQQATRILEVIVNDTDDNIPLFKRDVVSIIFFIKEFLDVVYAVDKRKKN